MIMKNNNRQVIKTITRRSLEHSKKNNRIIIVAIILTAMMFNVVFTLTSSMLKSMQWQEMQQAGTTVNGEINNITWKQYEKLKKDSRIKDCSYMIRISTSNNKELNKRNVVIRYAPEKVYSWSFSKLLKGHAPRKKNEIVLDQITLRALNVPEKLGQKITLSYKQKGKVYQTDFVLSGYYEGNNLTFNTNAYCSKEFLDDLIPESSQMLAMKLYLNQESNIAQQLDKIITDNLSKGERRYVKNNVDWDPSTIGFDSLDSLDQQVILLVLFIIIIAAYFIIHNVFMISIMREIQFYGLLKTIGTTKEQLGKLIRRRANYFCMIGIPIGVVSGILLGNLLTLVFLNSDSNNYPFQLSISPLICIFSMLLSYVTVQISCLKPGRMVSKISAMKALKFMDIDQKFIRKEEKRRSKKFSYLQMAKNNLLRNRSKTCFVTLSMILSLSLLIIITSVINSVSINKYARTMISGDLVLSSNSVFTQAFPVDITKEVKENSQYIKNMGIATKRHDMYVGCVDYKVDQTAYQRYLSKRKANKIDFIPAYKEYLAEFEREKDNALINMRLYGFDVFTASNLKITEGTFDQKKYDSGNYIILVNGAQYAKKSHKDGLDNMSHTFFKVGDKIKMGDKTYRVMAYADLPYYNSIPMYSVFEVFGVVNQNGLLNNKDTHYDLISGFDSKTKMAKTKTVKPFIYSCSYELLKRKDSKALTKAEEMYTKHVDKNLSYMSEAKIVKEMTKERNMILYLGGGFTIFIAVIAVLNFMNNIRTGILTRRKEFAMLRSVGMEKRQLLRMLYAESLIYIGISYVVGSIIAYPIAVKVIKVFCHKMDWFVNAPTMVPLIISLPIFIAIGVFIPYFAYQKEGKQSIVELLRVN
ncbi:ABC transporter, ATP-binding protein [Lachnospiraceae bacterium KM106-2]|nr:ABC transporter, ATP-binding protein [Lachnospiraceae bacterium KM106-2]